MGDWVLLVALVVLLLLRAPPVARAAGRLLTRVGAWAQARAAAIEAPDPESEELWVAYRRQRLSLAVERVSRLVATDEWMTATRQIGNRIALDALLDELSRLPEPGILGTATSVDWAADTPSPYTEFVLVPGHSAGRVVEVLELGRW